MPAESEFTDLFIQVGLVIFLTVFFAILIWTLVGRRDRFARHAQIPLSDEPVTPVGDDANRHDHEPTRGGA
ncbi:MAG: cbb3-type cytochrome oxidase subunit 3 [Phycisphaerales bacterium]